MEERIGGIQKSRLLSPEQKETSVFGLRRLDALNQKRQQILDAPKGGASFAGPVEFAKQFQLQISGFGRESKQNIELEKIAEKQLILQRRFTASMCRQ